MDVTNEESMQSAVHYILKQEGKIDVLINNASYGSYGAIEDVTIEEAKKQFEVNLLEHLLQQANIPNLLWKEELVVNEQQYYNLLQVFNQYVSDQQILAFSEIENINIFMSPIYAALSAENGMEALKRFISYKN